MRLINADDLIKTLDGVWDCNDMVFEPNDCICDPLDDCKGCKWRETLDFAKRQVKASKTVDAVPVVHGKWMHDNYGANFCSECMKFAYEDEEYHMIWHTNFCPHCGAKMDERKDGEQDD